MMISAINMLAEAGRISLERRLEMAAMPEGWPALVLAALVAGLCWAIVWMYRREGRAGAGLRARWVMAVIRCLVVLCIVGIWLEPVLATYLHRLVDSYTLVLVDTSSSMDLQDRYRDGDAKEKVRAVTGRSVDTAISRRAITEKIVGNDQNRLLTELAKRNRVRVITFDEAPRDVITIRATREGETDDDAGGDEPSADDRSDLMSADRTKALDLEFRASGAATDLGRAVRESIESLGSAPIAAAVVLTDGGVNRGDSIEDILRYVEQKRVPLHIVGVGDPAPPRNVRVAEIIAPDNVFAEDPFAVITQIAHQRMIGESIEVQLIEKRADGRGDERLVASRSVTLGADGSAEPVTFQHRQGAVGRYVYRINVPVAEVESIADDNVKQVTVNVIDNKLRVLLVSGAPSWEYRYLSRLLQRDETFEVSCWLQSADVDAVRDGNVVIDHLPATPEEIFAYDAVVLLDPDPIELTAEWCDLAARLVKDHGGGVLFAAARLNTPSFVHDPAVGELLRILPVTLDSDADLLLNEMGHYQQDGSPIVVPPTSAGHPVMKLPADDSGVPSRWSTAAKVFWYYPVLREKPVATVLMRHGDPRSQNAYGGHVLLATQYVGSGRTAFLGFDGTWRWRQYGDTLFNKFWVQLIRYLVEGKLAGGNRRGMLLTENDTYQLGDAVSVSARLLDRAFQPATVEQVEAEYAIEGDGGSFLLRREDDRPGWYEGRFVPPRTGGCEISLTIPDGDPLTDRARKEIQVVRPDLEILEPQMNRDGLVRLAEQSPDGRYYEIDQAASLAEHIPDRHESTTIRSRPEPLWDNRWMLGGLVILLGLEWSLRKLFRLL